MAMLNILVVEDNDDMCELLCKVLSNHGYNSLSASDGIKALDMLDEHYIDLIIADVMMPNMNGYELTKTLRETNFNMPILLVTAKGQFEDMKKGFSYGADDYMVKPINVDELVLRVEALLRRAKIASENKIVVGSTVLNSDSLSVTINDDEIVLPKKEFNLLFKLLSYPNKIFTRQQLMDEIWGMYSDTDDRTINTHINRLRDKLQNCKDFEIITVRGLGYKVVRNDEKK
jgi:DNA-binding response OmpR family regulator